MLHACLTTILLGPVVMVILFDGEYVVKLWLLPPQPQGLFGED